jgi:hypothetical protein
LPAFDRPGSSSRRRLSTGTGCDRRPGRHLRQPHPDRGKEVTGGCPPRARSAARIYLRLSVSSPWPAAAGSRAAIAGPTRPHRNSRLTESYGVLEPTLPADKLAREGQWDIQVATVGLTPLASTIRVGGLRTAPSDARFQVPKHRAGLPRPCPVEVDPERPDLNVPFRLGCWERRTRRRLRTRNLPAGGDRLLVAL